MKNNTKNKVSNLKIYESNLRKNYTLKGTLVGVAISTVPLSFAFLSNVLGMNIMVENANFIGDFINDSYVIVTSWPVALSSSAVITTLSAITGLDKANHKIKKNRRNLRY